MVVYSGRLLLLDNPKSPKSVHGFPKADGLERDRKPLTTIFDANYLSRKACTLPMYRHRFL